MAQQTVEQLTFTEKFQKVATAFVAGINALKTSNVTVESAKGDVKIAQDQLASTEQVARESVLASEDLKTHVKSTRDDLVTVLQSWTP